MLSPQINTTGYLGYNKLHCELEASATSISKCFSFLAPIQGKQEDTVLYTTTSNSSKIVSGVHYVLLYIDLNMQA